MQIELNGKWQHINCKTAFDARAQFGNPTDIIILNGFQIDRDYLLSENDTLTLSRKGTMPSQEELESMMMARHTPEVHKKLKTGSVAIAGLGGLGSNIAVMLARIGVGRLLLVDFDIVEPSNLNRQSYYIRHLGMPKTEALQSQLEPAINELDKKIDAIDQLKKLMEKRQEVLSQLNDKVHDFISDLNAQNV